MKVTSITRYLLLILMCAFVSKYAYAQGVIVQDKNSEKNTILKPRKIDPARYEKLLFYNFKIGQSYSDDRGFNSLLKYYGFKPGVNEFINLGADFNYLNKKVALGFKADFGFQSKPYNYALWHRTWQASIGTTLIRKKGTVFIINANLGKGTSTIKFGDITPPDFLANLNYVYDRSKLFQGQFVAGPSLNLGKLIDKNGDGKGLSIGVEAGANFAPFKPIWQYGYNGPDNEFIGERINDMPQAARQTFYTTIKIGFWEAR